MSEVEQVGGNHYQSQYQHWDWAEEVGLGYLEGCATKYLVRWREKGGLQDLDKSLSYVRKLLSIHRTGLRHNRARALGEGHHMVAFRRFVDENSVPTSEATVCLLLQVWRDDAELDATEQMIRAIIEEERGSIPEYVDEAFSEELPLDPQSELPIEDPTINSEEVAQGLSLLAEATLRLSEKRDKIPSPTPDSIPEDVPHPLVHQVRTESDLFGMEFRSPASSRDSWALQEGWYSSSLVGIAHEVRRLDRAWNGTFIHRAYYLDGSGIAVLPFNDERGNIVVGPEIPQSNFSGDWTVVLPPPQPTETGEPLDGYVNQDPGDSHDFPF